MNSESLLILFAMPGVTEMIIILVIILLLFGAKKIPELAKGLGKGIKEFKDAKDEAKNEGSEKEIENKN